LSSSRDIDGATNPTTPTNSTTPANPTTPTNPTTPATPMKSEKLPDPPMFSGSREDLRPFVSKLRIKLDMNADPSRPSEASSCTAYRDLMGTRYARWTPSTGMGDSARSRTLLFLLEHTYDDASREHTAINKVGELKAKK
jgi:hypothetical protein